MELDADQGVNKSLVSADRKMVCQEEPFRNIKKPSSQRRHDSPDIWVHKARSPWLRGTLAWLSELRDGAALCLNLTETWDLGPVCRRPAETSGAFLCLSPLCLLLCLGLYPGVSAQGGSLFGALEGELPSGGSQALASATATAPRGLTLGHSAWPPPPPTTYRRLPLLLFHSWASGQSWWLCQPPGRSHTPCDRGLLSLGGLFPPPEIGAQVEIQC